jgi:hypothetical protein
MIHVDLNPDVEARLIDQARALGIETDTYARVLIEDAVRAAPVVKGRSLPGGGDIAMLLDALADAAADLPELPEAAFTRASFYDERGG